MIDPYEEAAIIAPIPETYTIQPGDSLLAISLRFFGDANMVYAILELNGLEDPDMIIAGRTISLPRR
ncbi:MAG: LysM domain-containing protein [Defluviitaleaceae bacterium]|nr:LysM domain-containing protein [Defluviitaleaceae bacterium]